jgi:dihydropyrimidinase
MYDLLVLGGTVVTETSIRQLDIGVTGDQIAAIGLPGVLGSEAAKVVEAEGCYVIPGGVDTHVHYTSPRIPTRAGDIECETQDYSFAAALGGVTTIIDFAFQGPPQTLHDAVDDKKKEAEGRMAVDYGLHAALTKDFSHEVIDEIGDVIKNGIPTIKTLMIYPYFMSDDGRRWEVMTRVAEHGGMSMVHAEDHALNDWLREKYVREGKTHGAYTVEIRGPLVEEAAVRRAMLLAERSGSSLFVLHLGAGSAVEALAEGRAKGLPFYGETLPQYLSFTADKLWDDEARGLLWATTPPLKYQEDQDVLWQALADDRLQVVASDHFAITSQTKFEEQGTTIESLMAGYHAIELRMELMFHSGVQEGRIGLRRFVELTSTNPAKLMGLYPKKGTLSQGADADIVVIDPQKTWTVHADDLHSIADYTHWEGWELKGKVVTTIMRGSVLVDDGSFVGSKTGGQFIPRTLDRDAISHPRAVSTTSGSGIVGLAGAQR